MRNILYDRTETGRALIWRLSDDRGGDFVRKIGKKLLAIVLVLSMVAVFVPVRVSAAIDVSGLTCADFISNVTARTYIDTMMQYYISSNSNLQSTLSSGKSVVFMFEGGSDNYWSGSVYNDVTGDVRNQAVVIVVQMNSSGTPYIAFYNENCSSVPDDPTLCTYGVGYSGATTVMDGIYSFYTTNHTGPYGAFQLNLGTGYYTPTSAPDGYTLGASGLNIHTRAGNTCGGHSAGWSWSLGCQLIDSGSYSGNAFNQFMKTVAGISYNVWLDYYGKSFNTITTGVTKGYYVVDRQLAKMNPSGVEFGSGSLIELYNSTALNNITASSTTARNNAGLKLDYIDQCTYYPAHCNMEITYANCELRGAPCSAGTHADSTLIDNLIVGDPVVATGIYKNLYGNYWYEIRTADGQTGYIYSENAKFISENTTDITLSGAVAPNGHGKGQSFDLSGKVACEYNRLTEVSVQVYSGLTASGNAVTAGTATLSDTSLELSGSAIGKTLAAETLDVGNYTYVITATYQSYHATDATTLQAHTGTVTLMEEIFAVVPTATDPVTCTHRETTYDISESTCTTAGVSVRICDICGRVTEFENENGHPYSDWTVNVVATCTTDGSRSRTCTACGHIQTQTVTATGHTYNTVTYPATCLEYAKIKYVCASCKHSYTVSEEELMSRWLEALPEGVDPSKVETKTQYSYSEYETITSDTPLGDGYTQIGVSWKQTGSGTKKFVESWPEGFLSSNSLYNTYKPSGLTATQTDTYKCELGSKKLVGYVYYHWCYGTYLYGPLNRTTSKVDDGIHSTFHAFAEVPGVLDPTSLSPASDGSVTYAMAEHCTDSHWWYYIPVYEQSYTEYAPTYTYGRWSEYSDWSDTPVAASDTRRVKTRTLYRYSNAQLGGHNMQNGACTVCGTPCDHTYSNSICTVCGQACVHQYTGGICSVCGAACSHRFSNGACVICAQPCAHSYSAGVCSVCGLNCTHRYTGGSCTVCGEAEPIKDYYLCGFINGANYGCEEDAQNLGQYRFVDGKLVATFKQDSLVCVKTDNNLHWYMTMGWLGEDTTAATLYDSATISNADKLFVPGNVEITFSLTVNQDGTLTLNCDYEKLVVPTLTLNYPTLAFEDQIQYNIYFTATNTASVVEMGLITFDTRMEDGTVADAVDVIPGYVDNGTACFARSGGIAAKNLGDTLYFKVYARLSDGSFAYSDMAGYHAVAYAKTVLGSSATTVAAKQLMIAMLNYGAAAQVNFDYKTDSLMNAFLSDNAQKKIATYDESMVDAVITPSTEKAGHFVLNKTAFTKVYPSVSFEGSFAINYYLETGLTPDNGVSFCYWDADTYAKADRLTTANANGVVPMNFDGTRWHAMVDGIAAKDMDKTVFIAAIYRSGGTVYTTSVIPYSLGRYCETIAANGNAFGAATAVYGYYAKAYFNN